MNQPLITFSNSSWDEVYPAQQQSQAIGELENGKILMFPQLSFLLSSEERRFLSARFVDPKTKNISYNLHTDVLGGALASLGECEELKSMLKRFSQQAQKLVQALFPLYSSSLEVGRTSLRPVEIVGRETSYRKDDKRLHVDAFPSSPNQGKRIIRVFSNIDVIDGKDRVWRVGESFEKVAQRFLPQISKFYPSCARLLQLLRITKSYRTEYDHIMLQIHDRMKADEAYQRQVPQNEVRFSPGNSWVVQTDHVSHAAMSGQHLLEQTFYLPVKAMQNPNLSPLKVLERLTGRALT